MNFKRNNFHLEYLCEKHYSTRKLMGKLEIENVIKIEKPRSNANCTFCGEKATIVYYLKGLTQR